MLNPIPSVTLYLYINVNCICLVALHARQFELLACSCALFLCLVPVLTWLYVVLDIVFLWLLKVHFLGRLKVTSRVTAL